MTDPWARYDLATQANGSIVGTYSTNGDPDQDAGGDLAEVPISFQDLDELLRRTGGTHYGCSGIKVDVVLDGVYVPAPSAQAVPA